MKKYTTLFLLAFIAIFSSCNGAKGDYQRGRIDLQGKWQFELDSLNEGIEKNWQTKAFADLVDLPGTTDTNKKGILNTKNDETTFLSRTYSYVGKAWYKKEVDIPEDWKGKNVSLFLERTKPTNIWVDGKKVGSNDNVSTQQVYDLTPFLSPGKHDIVIMVDNGQSVPPQLLSNSHAYTESTQTNWNGIIGEIYLEATNILHIQDVQIYPDAKDKSILVKIKLSNSEKKTSPAKIELQAEAWNTDKKHKVKAISQDLDASKDEIEIKYTLGDDALLWSEFHPSLYKLKVTLDDGTGLCDSKTINFGLRDFKAKGSQFTINDNLTFLRGKHDACVFPLTAHVAMDLETWRKYFQIAKQYGINHYRFHSWCPPKACFDAADIEGIYLQPELPFWGTLKKEDDRLNSFLTKEGVNIQNAYGNHASFVMFALGNELFGDQEVMDNFVKTFRDLDIRHLYAFGANNFLGFRGQIPGEDFLVTCRIGGEEQNSFNTHVRGSFSFADAYNGGYINHTYPNSVMNFSKAIGASTVPVISHETGQFQIYPNYNEIKKYTGVLQPRNFEIFKKRLEDAGMPDQADDFFEASGKWSALLYRAEIEMDLRTAGFGGFQLLDLQDYPGQGSAFVGILDAFMDSKGIITAEEWREFCSPVVPLFTTEKFCWTNNESLEGNVKIANYSEASLDGKSLYWELKSDDQRVVDKGTINIKAKENGLIDLGAITPKIVSIAKAEKVVLKLSISDTDYKNSYPLWIYPEKTSIEKPAIITIADRLDNGTIERLKKGESVLLFPNRKQYEQSTVGGLFQTDYWNYRMFKTISESIKRPVSPGTLGILTKPEHPIFADFPTDFHTNWQWFPIVKNSYPLIMDRMPVGYKPIVQVIDNVERNHKLGLIFEFQVESGKLLVCMSDLNAAMDKPETRQLYHSMLNYMNSDNFKPTTKIGSGALTELFSPFAGTSKIEILENISYK
ncbi:sugar-binding domain-containing protein [Dysgonomonas sp. ZJ279]|uniref:sugar-binding domain-containing protein n=1 Tax=Dysgonomonas sp. ZJ279 TaxID=2709796 RepID=UPI0013ED1E3E|nr:sugar-binding domain-containing protein [Dysgonomonas sp. ZJ279]